MGSRIVRVAVAVLVAAGWALAGGAVGQAAEGEDDRAYLERTCRRVIDMHPTDDLDKETDPDPGSKVAPGDVIKVKLTWDRDWWEGNDLHKVLDCVTVDGELDLDLSSEEKPTDNDGVYETEIPVPDDASDGTEICNIGFVSGEGPEDDFEQKPSDEICFEVERDNPPHEDAAPPPGDRDDSPPPGDRDDSPPPGDRDDSPPPPLVEEPEVAAPPVTHPPAPEVTAPPSGPPKVAPPPVVAGETEDRPAPQRPAPAPAEEAGPPTPLARTGPSDLLLVLGGCGLALGGLAVMGAHRRPRTGR